MTISEIEARYPGKITERLNNHWNYRFPGGENYVELALRAGKWLGDNNADETTIAITHDTISRVIRKQYLGSTISECLSMKHRQNEYFILSDGQVRRKRVELF